MRMVNRFLGGFAKGAACALLAFIVCSHLHAFMSGGPQLAQCIGGNHGLCCDICNHCVIEWDYIEMDWYCDNSLSARCKTVLDDPTWCVGCDGACKDTPLKGLFMGNDVLHCPCKIK